ncbi:hypothetical protein BDV96DRAFT_502942 [Lophiotrema nucula]|uniref:Elongator complex protein 6 n=1 Tax=Lophiotrema nucula TaxID=690887 RepID=A0A6A5YQK5_9PLEO|nr:hypothetical protein BDV96DRAFT_502942 [Lophiotrema nucula]
MPPSSRIPPLLQPYTRLPAYDSLFLLTSTLGASANWLIIRFLCEALANEQDDAGAEREDVAVVLVSWMRDWDFWKSEGRKGGGLDLERLKREGRLRFVDGLSGLYLPSTPEAPQQSQPPVSTSGASMPRVAQNVLPVRGPPGRIPTRTPTAPVHIAKPASETLTPQSSTPADGQSPLISPDLKTLATTIQRAMESLKNPATRSRKTLLILDSPDALLATQPIITPSDLCSTILQLHEKASHVLVHLNADDALLSLSTPPQPLEVEGHNLLVKMAHVSSRILSCRVLDTGVARDVSGVLRITGGGSNTEGWWDESDNRSEEEQGRELLYLAKGDGSVKVFERGAGEG